MSLIKTSVHADVRTLAMSLSMCQRIVVNTGGQHFPPSPRGWQGEREGEIYICSSRLVLMKAGRPKPYVTAMLGALSGFNSDSERFEYLRERPGGITRGLHYRRPMSWAHSRWYFPMHVSIRSGLYPDQLTSIPLSKEYYTFQCVFHSVWWIER
jgi:hypothetical protein